MRTSRCTYSGTGSPCRLSLRRNHPWFYSLTTRKLDSMLCALPVFDRLTSEYRRKCRVTQEWVI